MNTLYFRSISLAAKVLFFLSIVTFLSCNDNATDVHPTETDATLNNFTQVASFTKEEVKEVLMILFADAGVDITDMLENAINIKVYSIEYTTKNIDGSNISVSGLVGIPDNYSGVPSIMQYHHGTKFNNQNVPSNLEKSDEAYACLAVFCGQGYIISLPDYIGQGISTVAHPYLHKTSMIVSCIDMLHAVNELCQTLKINHSGKLFITGISQGGHATLALQKYIENNKKESPFNLVSSAPIAGPYNVWNAWKFWFENPPDASALAGHVILSYKELYNFEETLNDIFLPPFNEQILTIDNGEYNCEQMRLMLPTTLDSLLQDDFIKAVNSGNHPMYNALLENSFGGYVPSTPTMLLHGIDDEQLPYSHSVEIYNYWNENGASNVILINVGEGFTHVGSFVPGILYAKSWFDEF